MGLFGGMKLPPMPGPISGYGGGTFNMDGAQVTPVDTQPFIPTGDFGPRPAGIDEAAAYTGPAKKGGLFGSGVKWQQIAGILGDTLMNANGGGMPYTQMQMQRSQQDNLLKRMQAQRQAELQDQMALYDYKRANPEPVEDSFTRALSAAGIQRGSKEWQDMARKRAKMLTNPVQLVPDGYGGVRPVQPYGEDDAPPTEPVGELRPYNGGPGSSGGGFPR